MHSTFDVTIMGLNDLFYYSSLWRIVVCRECGTVSQTDLYHYICLYHNPLQVYTRAVINSFVQIFNYLPLLQDLKEIYYSVRPSPGASPIPHLQVFYDGISCELCKDDATAISAVQRSHRRKVHGEEIRRPGRKCIRSLVA